MNWKNVALIILISTGVLFSQEKKQPPKPAKMTFVKLDKIIRNFSTTVQQGPNFWQFLDGDIQMMCIVDTTHDRMRVITPIIDTDELTEEHKEKIMAANFHSALDARYAANDGVLYSAFIHPLSPLREKELRAALKQVSVLARTFGTTYSSSELIFGGQTSDK